MPLKAFLLLVELCTFTIVDRDSLRLWFVNE